MSSRTSRMMKRGQSDPFLRDAPAPEQEMTRGHSDSFLQTPTAPKQALKTSSLRRMSSGDLVNSPTSVLHSEFYAPSRQKRVTFAAEVFQKAVPAPQRLQKLGINDVDFGGSFARAAFTSETPQQTYPQLKTRSKRTKSIQYLENRIHKIATQLLEASFEVEVSKNELDEIENENAELKREINEREDISTGTEKLRMSVLEMKQKSRKYSSKISVLQKAIAFFDDESRVLTEQLLQSKITVLQYSKERLLAQSVSSAVTPSAA